MIQIGDTIKDGTAVFKVKKFASDGALVGSVTWYAGSGTPENYFLCDGSAISRKDYADLFAVIGTTYGAGDGSTIFNLPLLTDGCFIEGSNIPGTQHEAGLPNITATLGSTTISSGTPATNKANEPNPFYEEDLARYGTQYSNNHLEMIYFDASRANGIYGNSKTVQPKSLTLRPLIKYI